MTLLEIFKHKLLHDESAFKQWFGNSKIIDDEGNPAICYHASPNDFKEFIPGGVDPKISGYAMWFSMDPHNQPAAHNTNVRGGYRTGTNVMPVYIKMERPLVIDTIIDLEWARQVFANGSSEFPQIMLHDWVKEVTKDGEYDGIYFDAKALGWRDGVVELVVFNPKQVKSALGNSGDFGNDTSDITR